MRALPIPPLHSERTRMAGLVLAVGVGGGLVGAAYLTALKGVAAVLGPDRWADGPHLVILVLVGASVTGLIRLLGTPGDVELLVNNIHVDGGRDDVRSLRSLIPVSLLCVGAGGTLGPEAPLVTTTGTLASWLGVRRQLSRRDRRVIAITGMAAGFTVLFAAPLGSAVFALEILHRRGLEYYEALLPAVVGALCGYGISAALTVIGVDPIWSFPAPEHLVPMDFALAIAAGVVGALVAIAFTYLSIGLRAVADRLPTGTQPAIGGAILGLIALASPYALTNGELQIDHLSLTGAAAVTFLVAALAKLAAAAVSVATGWRGGFIIPLFFVGFALAQAADGHLGSGSTWVLAAGLMVACNVGVTKTPLGSTLVVTEMSGAALMPTTLIAALVSLALTSQVGLIHTQRRRFTALPVEGEAEPPDRPDDLEVADLSGRPAGAARHAEDEVR